MIRKRFLQAMYLGFKCLIGFGFKLFYSKTVTDQAHFLDTKGPLILLGNHPNGMIDPLNIALLSNRMVHFLAKSQLFGTWFTNWFFNTFYCIPVERPDFANGQLVNNEKNFERCDNFLADGGALFIAPEGTSLDVRRILPLKTGAARIALNAESKNDFKLGLKFVASGITYVNQGSFWSGQYIITTAPIGISDYKEMYSNDSVGAFKHLSLRLHEELKSLNIHLENDGFLPNFEKIIRWLYRGIESDPRQFYLQGKSLADKINILDQTSTNGLQVLDPFIGAIDGFQKKWRISEAQVQEVLNDHSLIKVLTFFLLALIGFPFMVAGFILHFLPNFLPWLVEKLAKQHKIYIATTKFMVGFFTYLIYYPLLVKLFINAGYSWYQNLGFIIFTVITGLLFFPYLSILASLKSCFISYLVNQSEKDEIKKQILTLKDLIYK